MKIRFFFFAWAAGLPGILAVVTHVLPELVKNQPLPVPMWVIQLMSAVQSAVLLGVAVFAGVSLAHKIGLTAPVLSALAEKKPVAPAFRSQLIPGLLGGLAGGLLLGAWTHYAPVELAQLQARFSMPAAARLLYGGITEELLLRWGVMTVVAWGFWRVRRSNAGLPSQGVMWAAIAVSAILFGLGHLPAATALLGHVSAPVAAYIVAGNAAFGFLSGWLYWRFGLESAILAHAGAHAVFLLAFM